MAATETPQAVDTAARVPGPPELLPGRPDAIVDLQADEGAALVGGQWRYSDATVEEIGFVELGSPEDPLGPGTVPNRTYDVAPHAEGAGYDVSDWRLLRPEETMLRLANGRVCFNWYRIDVTVPERIGELDMAGSTIVFEVTIDDYAEVWVNGQMPLALGLTGGSMLDAREIGPGELRATSVEGGEPHQLSEGDVLAIPNAVPHQFVEVSDPFLYFVVKVEA